jgi:sortase A
MKSARQWPFAAVLVTAAFFLIRSMWIPVKAEVAQKLLEQAWTQTLQGNSDARPWPWADTRPVGILEVPGLGIRQIILSGTSGRNLAFGPTLLTSPKQGDLVLSGHRDTHFSFTKSLEQGEVLKITTLQGVNEYRVSWLEVIDSRSHQMVLEPGVVRLTLMTCYPFDATTAGGPLRYVVTAEPVEPEHS